MKLKNGFFFSSRRRHTRYWRDWSSDVCSSDLPGALRVLGTPVHLSRITLPTFVTGALTDHITPWYGCYRTTQLLSGPSTFVLSSSGHIQSLVNPPGNPKIGRASCRERVEISVVAVSLKKNKKRK